MYSVYARCIWNVQKDIYRFQELSFNLLFVEWILQMFYIELRSYQKLRTPVFPSNNIQTTWRVHSKCLSLYDVNKHEQIRDTFFVLQTMVQEKQGTIYRTLNE
jgi:hypothetical protein